MSRITIRKARVLACLGAAALLFAACSSSSSNGTSTTSTTSSTGSTTGSTTGSGASYTWGIDAELSGELAFYGDSLEQGIEAYVDTVNAQGGINGHKITLKTLDNGASESEAATDETQLATADKAIAVFGSILSADCSASTAIAARYTLPTACLSVVTANPYIYSLGADNLTSAGADIAAAPKVSGIAHPSIALLCLNTLTDATLKQKFPGMVSAAGDKLATIQEVALTATDVSVEVSDILASKPNVVVVTDTGPGFVQVLKGLQSGGLNVPVLYIDGNTNVASLTPLTATNIYPMGATPIIDPSSTDPFVQAYVAGLRKAGVTPTVDNINGVTLESYLAAYAFGQAMKTCGSSCTGATMKAALDKTSLNLGALDPSYVWTATNHLPFPSWFVYHFAGGKFVSEGTYPASADS